MDIHAYIDQSEQELVRKLKGLLRIPSLEGTPEPGAPFGIEVKKSLDYALEMCRDLGLHAVNVDGYAGYAELEGATGEQIGVLTHLDVVPTGTGWKHPPFAAVNEDGVIYARGICDDKGPLVASIYALAAIKQAGLPLNKNIRLIFGCNEETGWGCMTYYDKHVGLPNVGFSPDADYPIINTEKGIYHGIITAEVTPENPQNNEQYQVCISGGERANVVMPIAHAEVRGNIDRLSNTLLNYDCTGTGIAFSAQGDTLQITATGVSAHASTPENGQNAGLAIITMLDELALGGANGKLFALLRKTLCKGTDGSGVSLKFQDDISGALTMNLGILSLKDGNLSFTLDIRYPVTMTDVQVRTALQTAFPEFIVTDGHLQAPHHTPKEHYLVQALARVYHKRTGKKAECLAIGGGTYARALKTGVAFGVTRPGAPELAHNVDERMSVSDLMEDVHMFADVYAELLK